MRRITTCLAAIAAIALTAGALSSASRHAEAGLIGGGGGLGDYAVIDGCGTIQDQVVFLFGMPYAVVRVWVPDAFGFTVRGGQLDQFDPGDKVYIEGLALLAQTNVFPPLPGLPLVEAAFSDCD